MKSIAQRTAASTALGVRMPVLEEGAHRCRITHMEVNENLDKTDRWHIGFEIIESTAQRVGLMAERVLFPGGKWDYGTKELKSITLALGLTAEMQQAEAVRAQQDRSFKMTIDRAFDEEQIFVGHEIVVVSKTPYKDGRPVKTKDGNAVYNYEYHPASEWEMWRAQCAPKAPIQEAPIAPPGVAQGIPQSTHIATPPPGIPTADYGVPADDDYPF